MPHIFLYGPPGSGKSTLGRMLANALQLPFVDLDQEVQVAAGMSIAGIMGERGEAGFRELESSVLRENLAKPGRVIALGGGTLLLEENRALAEGSGSVLCLNAGPALLLPRLRADANQRPLLQGDLAQMLAALLAARGSHYSSFARQFDAGQPPEELIQQFQRSIGRFHLGAMGGYDVLVEPGGLDRLGQTLQERQVAQPILVTDENVAGLYSERVLDSLCRAGYDTGMLTIQPGESAKTLDTVASLWHGFLQAGLDRRSTVIALGGGVVGDLAGFAASTFMRGIDWVCVPSTVLSMVDASLGGKTGFDLLEGKNLIGAFHAPSLVLSDPETLSTLPDVEFRAGLAEVIKHGIVADPELFNACAMGVSPVRDRLPDVLRRAIAVKVRIVEADPFEKGERASLNFGHTVGHAVELVSRFGIRHGEAVAIGMVAEARLAERLAIAPPGLSQRIAAALSKLGLPIYIPESLPRLELIRAMHADKKKAAGVVRFALPAEIGRMQVNVEVKDLDIVFEEQ